MGGPIGCLLGGLSRVGTAIRLTMSGVPTTIMIIILVGRHPALLLVRRRRRRPNRYHLLVLPEEDHPYQKRPNQPPVLVLI